jgi:ribosomal protein L37AE/L43A
MNKKCEICWVEPATIECDDGVWRCDNCAISAGYAYLVDERKKKSLVDIFTEDEDEDNEEDDNED